MKIDMEQMRTFLHAAEYGSIVKASEAMGASQSTVNSRIKAMSKELGMPLLERSGRGVSVTEKGEIFLGYVMRTLDLIEEGIAEVNRARSMSQPVAVAADTAMGTWFLPQVVTQFRSKNPDANTRIHVSSGSTIIDWVLNGKVDLGLVKGPVTHKGVKAMRIFSSPIIPIFHRSHPFAELEVLTPQDLSGQKLIIPCELTDEWARVRAWFDKQKLAYPEMIAADHPETMKQFVYKNIGYTFSSLIAVNEDLKTGKLLTASLKPPLTISQEAYMVYHRSLPLSDMALQFRDFLLQEDFAS